MNYRKTIAMMALLAAIPASAQKPCKVEGKVAEDFKVEKMYIYLANDEGVLDGVLVDSADVKNGKFTYTASTKDARIALFMPVLEAGKTISQNQKQLMLVPDEKVTMTVSQKDFELGGSKFYQQWGAASKFRNDVNKEAMDFAGKASQELQALSGEQRQERMAKLQEEYNKILEARSQKIEEYYQAHKKEEGAVMLYIMADNVTKYYAEMDPAVKNGRFKGYLAKENADMEARIKAQEAEQAAAKAAEAKTAEGQMFTDFEAEYNGKVQKLSDYVGKGKYVLVDFWASWCGPCKAEIPNLIEAYNKYKGDKFEVLGVATWDKPKDTEKAIEQMKIPYPQIMNAQKAGSDAYGIEGIPQIILFGPDGKIVKRNLRGAQIEQTLKDLLGQK